jgi:hypothetical protein
MVYCKENHQDAMIGGISTNGTVIATRKVYTTRYQEKDTQMYSLQW